MSGYDRSHSILQMTSPLGDDVLIPVGIAGNEAVSQAFSYHVRIVSERGDIDATQLLSHPGCVILRRDEEVARYFHGIFQEFAADGMPRPGMYAYHAVLVPKVWFLGQTSDCRVFQKKTVVEILQQMFRDAGVDKVEFRVYGERRQREYTVQFNETDLQFGTRLMEEEGYFFFFEHSADAHTMVIADANSAFRDIPHARLRFDAQTAAAEDVLTRWNRPHGTAHGKHMLKDYDPSAPGKRLEDSTDSTLRHGGVPARDVFHWPAATHEPAVVRQRTRLLMEAAEAAVHVSDSGSTFRGLYAGGRFQLGQTEGSGDDEPHVIRGLSFEATDESWTTEGAPASYSNSFDCFPNSVKWRQPMAVPRPDMGGVHSAIVLGPEGEEIYTDDLARVKVRFFWDYRKEATADKSCWARVLMPWAGNGWGTQFIPRVGTEVLVAFMDGDADRPVVLGGLYNGQDKPIYAESEKTKTGWRSRSSLKGGSNDFNELTFDDKTGDELVYMHAEKDHTVKVENDQKITVHANRTTIIETGDDKLTVQQGDLTIDVTMGKITITALQSIDLKVGQSTIHMDQASIKISAMTVTVEGSLLIDEKAPMINVKGSAMTVIEGGIVKIN